MIGSVIDGSFRVDRMIGEGGFGVVYQCTELELERNVALKMLRPGPVAKRDLDRFISEGRHLASLNHPNVVHIYRLGNHEGIPYIAMEFVSGRTLRAVVENDRPSVKPVLEIMRQVANGLGAIHGMGMLHRDLTPNNIMVLDDGTAKILDFGLAKSLGDQTSMNSLGTLVGTMSYVSPEQLNQDQSGFPSEVFVFGVILYEALCREHPFAAEHPMSLFYNIAHRAHDPLESKLTNCPGELGQLVSRCLAKQPKDRPATIGEVEQALVGLLEGHDHRPIATLAAEPEVDTGGSMSSTHNPYLHRVMLKHRTEFFGRTQEVKRIYARLNATPPGSISVVGDRKIGKSSLLNYVYMRANREQNLEQPDKMVMVFLDLQQDKGMSMETFVRTLLGIAELELRGRVSLEGCTHNLDGVRELVQRLDSAGFRLVLILDEFEVVTTNPNFNLEFFSFLRYLANHFSVAYLTSSERDLQVLCHTKEISDSPFFNIFSNMRLSVFKRDEAEKLIREPSQRVGKPLAAHVDALLDLSGLFPMYLQMACSHAIEFLEENPDASEPDFKDVRRRFNEEAKLHFRYLWDSFDDHERDTLVRVVNGKNFPDSLRHVLSELEARNLVDPAGGTPRLFSSTFHDFVMSESGSSVKRPLLSRLFGGKR